jgi:hypothetical protein
MKYFPAIGTASPIQEFPIGLCTAVLLGDIESLGGIEYTHILAVYDPAGSPVLFVTAERNIFSDSDSHFLCLFDNRGHHNFDNSPDWADRDRFLLRALPIASEALGMPGRG